MMEAIMHWVREDPSELGRPQLAGTVPHDSMAIPMMLLNLVDQLSEGDVEVANRFKELDNWSAQRILSHLQVKKWVWSASLSINMFASPLIHYQPSYFLVEEWCCSFGECF